MRKKTQKTVRGTLREFVMVPITDPAEQAALDRRCREAEKLLAARANAKPKTRKAK
jgi:siroheme synthase (precorrin-2 oxidase/ferrochelatase)